jgi:hypothetical protein
LEVLFSIVCWGSIRVSERLGGGGKSGGKERLREILREIEVPTSKKRDNLEILIVARGVMWWLRRCLLYVATPHLTTKKLSYLFDRKSNKVRYNNNQQRKHMGNQVVLHMQWKG